MKAVLPAVLLVALSAPVAPPKPAEARPFRAVFLSDFNGPYGSTTYPAPLARVMQRIVNEWKPDIVLSAGDVVGAQKLTLTNAQRRAMWQAFDRNVAAPLRKAGIPSAFAVGNHDGSSLRNARGRFVYQADRAALAAYWREPAHRPALPLSDASRFPFAYTFVFRGVFFAVVDASSNELQDRAWLEAQLASPAALGARLRVVIGHLPLAGFSSERNTAGDVLRDAAALRALFERAGVLAYVSGHHAAYYPGRLGELNVLATGGIGGRDYVGHPGTARSTVTVADFDPAGGVMKLRTFDAASGTEVPVGSLPPRIEGLGGPVVRVTEFRRSGP